MAYDEGLAARIRAHLADTSEVEEKKMFGGLAFMVGGHMCVGVIGDELCARVGKPDYEALSEEPGARAMDFTGRPMRGWLLVGAEGIGPDTSLREWVLHCLRFNQTLPLR